MTGLGRAVALALRRHPSPGAIRAFQDAQLRRLVAHAADRVPFYQRLFARHGVRPADVQGLDDLRRLPTTEKRDFQTTPARDLVARGLDPDRLIVHRTSGSLGMPVFPRRTWLEGRVGALARLRMLHDLGVRPTDRRAGVGLARPRSRRARDRPQRVARALGFYRSTSVSCRQDPEAIADALAAIAPDVIMGYAGAIARVVQAVARRPRPGLSPRLVVTGAEVVTPDMRRLITRHLGARVLDWYGSHEAGMVAWECRRAGDYHVWTPGVALEVLVDGRPAAPGEAGEAVLTPLYSFAMPFIRYRQGDLVVQGDPACPCGAPFPTIREIRGRMLDYFRLPDGRDLHPYELTIPLLDDAAAEGWMAHYQFVQETLDRVTLWIVPVRPPRPDELARAGDTLRAQLGPAVTLDIHLVDDIPLGENGKFRVARSRLGSLYEAAPGG